MKRFLRIGAVAIAVALMFGSISCSNAFFVKKEGDGLLDQVKYEGTLGGSGTKDDPYIVKGGYTLKMPEAIDKGKYKICVQEQRKGLPRGDDNSDNYDTTEEKEVAVPYLEDYTFEARCRVVTMVVSADGTSSQTNYNDEEWPSKTFYFKVPHITNEKGKYCEFTDDGKKLVYVTYDPYDNHLSALKLTFDVEPKGNGEDSLGNSEYYCNFSLNSVEWRSRDTSAGKWSEWKKLDDEAFDDMPAVIKKATKFTYRPGYTWVDKDGDYTHGYYDPDQFYFENNYVWDDDKSLSENLTFCSIYSFNKDGETCTLYILGDMFFVVGYRSSCFGELKSDKTSFTVEVEDEEPPISSLSGTLGTDEYGHKTLELKVDGKSYDCSISTASVGYLEDVFSALVKADLL